MTNKHTKDQNDIALFRQLMNDVEPMTMDTADVRVRKPARRLNPDPGIISSPNYDIYPLEAESIQTSDEIWFKRPGIQDRVFRKLRKGQLGIHAELDLHGITLDKACIALNRFMRDRGPEQACIRIIHGKGYGSKGGVPVLKRNVQNWLQCNNEVLAYCSCKPADGGTGAIYVLLKNKH